MGSLTQLRVLYQPNRCALLESALAPGHAVIFDRQGKITVDSSGGYAELSKEFVVFVKVNWRKRSKFALLGPCFLLHCGGKFVF